MPKKGNNTSRGAPIKTSAKSFSIVSQGKQLRFEKIKNDRINKKEQTLQNSRSPVPSISRLHLRFPSGRDHKALGVDESRSIDELKRIYKDKNNFIRSKYKGNRAGDQKQTSGIPIFGISNPTERSGWSKGHNLFAHELTQNLRTTGGSQQISAENSHALGHGDLGVEHYLAAPPASKHQNTEQLAIELAMRDAATKLNHDTSPTDGQSMVRFKSTDIINPDTGALEVRRIKLSRRKDPSKPWGGDNEFVAIDHLMDGRRKGIKKKDAFALAESTYKALIDDKTVNSPFKDNATRKDSGDVVAPTRDQLSTHGSNLLAALRKSKSEKRQAAGNPIAPVNDREGINFIGPAFTDVSIKGGKRITGQNALSSTIDQITKGKDKSYREAFKTTAGLPADDLSKLEHSIPRQIKAMNEHYQSFTRSLNDSPSNGQIHQLFESVKNSSTSNFAAFQNMVQTRDSLDIKLADYHHLNGAPYPVNPLHSHPQLDQVLRTMNRDLQKRGATHESE